MPFTWQNISAPRPASQAGAEGPARTADMILKTLHIPAEAPSAAGGTMPWGKARSAERFGAGNGCRVAPCARCSASTGAACSIAISRGSAPDRMGGAVTRRIGKGQYRAAGRRSHTPPNDERAVTSAESSADARAGSIGAVSARWAGHGVAVLSKVYARSPDNGEDSALRPIEDGLNADTETPTQIHK